MVEMGLEPLLDLLFLTSTYIQPQPQRSDFKVLKLEGWQRRGSHPKLAGSEESIASGMIKLSMNNHPENYKAFLSNSSS